MMRMHRRTISAAIIWMMLTLVLTGCTSEASNIGVAKDKKGNVIDTGFTASTVGSFDSADTAVVLSTDLTNKAVSLVNMDTGKQYTLYYDGTTYVKDKHDGPMTISQIKAGDVVDVTFLKGKKKLASIKRSPEAWVYDNLDNYDLAGANRTARIGSLTYALPDEALVLSEGHRVEKEEVMAQDVVTITGIDHKIYCVKVDKGHGYLSLKNEQPLLGGWIEVGNRVIRQVTEDMLLVVPEGSYQVVLSNNGVGCVKEITVERNKEVVLDVSDVEIAEDKTGKILFSVTPETAKVSVDGKPVDISKAVEMRYGIHQVQVEANGYDTLTKYIQVGSEYATISFTLEESRKEDNNRDSISNNTIDRIPWQDTLSSISGNSISENTLSTISENALGTSNNNKVYIDSPKGVEVYVDGNYIGLAPVRFTKTPGTHQITLRKEGYETKSYTIYLENDKKDETYSFSELLKKGAAISTNQTIPGDVVSAVSGITNCNLIYGTDVAIAGDLATLQKPGITVVETAIRNAVKTKVGEREAAAYTFSIAENLMSVTAPGDTDGTGTVSVTIYRSGYERQIVSCSVVIKKKAEEEPPAQETEVTLYWITIPSEADDAIEKIVVDGIEYNDFPPKLSSGVHTIEVEAEGYEKWTREIEITPDGDTIEIDFEEKDGDESQGGTDGDEGSGVSQGGTDEDEGSGISQGGDDESSIGDDSQNGDNQSSTDGDNPEDGGLNGTEEGGEATISITQESHPIRNFFSSLFKK